MYKHHSGFSSLHKACKVRSNQIMQKIIQKGWNVSKCNDGGRTSLHIACEEDHVDIVTMLLKQNLCPFASDSQGYLSTDLAIQMRHKKNC